VSGWRALAFKCRGITCSIGLLSDMSYQTDPAASFPGRISGIINITLDASERFFESMNLFSQAF
jgi:hypothetical protein